MKILVKILSPRVKVYIKTVYHTINRLFRGRSKIVASNSIIELKTKNSNTFFGYYDITPFNDNDDIIYIELPQHEQYVNVVVNDLNGQKKRVLAQSKAWNWQQGCRLRWISRSSNIISFNDYVNGKYCNRILDIKTGKERQINWPLYDISHDSSIGLSLDFRRLGYLRPGYGYTCDRYTEKDFENHGIDIIDITHNKLLKSVSYKDIRKALNITTELKDCYINHLSFSPDDSYFLFFWIEIVKGYHKASLAVYDMNKFKIISLETVEKVSHYVWKDNNNILCTTYSSPNQCTYFIYNIVNKNKKVFCPQSLKQDGHPSYYKDNKIITDTYPNKLGFQYIYLVDYDKDEKETLVEIYSKPTVFGEKRTDLHPRFNSKKDLIAFDGNTRGKRSLYILKLK